MDVVFKERKDQVVSTLLFIQGAQPIYQYRQVLKLLKEMIQELEDYDKKTHLLDNINRYISSIKRRIVYCRTWAESWTQINVFNKEEEVLQEILKYILERTMACLNIEDKVERARMTYCLKIETFLKIHQTRKQSIENNFILEITEER
jgi:superfamily I DNA/RNA helicase